MDKLIEIAFQQGGMALAFVIMLFAYRELWAQRTKELKESLEHSEENRKILLAALEANTKAFMSLDSTFRAQQNEVQASRTEMHKKADDILRELEKQTDALAAHRLEEERILSGRTQPKR